jgi:hypothetical protein
MSAQSNTQGFVYAGVSLRHFGKQQRAVVGSVLIGAAISALHALIMMQIPMATSWLSYLHVSSIWTVGAFIAFWRE